MAWTKIDKTELIENVIYDGEEIYYDGEIVVYGEGISWNEVLESDDNTWSVID